MTDRIVKWVVPVDDQVHQIGSGPVVHVAPGASIDQVHVWTHDKPALAAIVGPTQDVVVAGTGQPLPEDARHLGTAVTEAGFVWHVIGLARRDD